MSEYHDQCDDNDSICPYCGTRYQVECEGYSEDWEEIECDDCGKNYHMHQSFSVTTFTSPDCSLNGSEHVWEMVDLNNGKRHEFCTVCDKCRPYTRQEVAG